MNWREPATANVVAVRLRTDPKSRDMALWHEIMTVRWGAGWLTPDCTAHHPLQPWIAVRP